MTYAWGDQAWTWEEKTDEKEGETSPVPATTPGNEHAQQRLDTTAIREALAQRQPTNQDLELQPHQDEHAPNNSPTQQGQGTSEQEAIEAEMAEQFAKEVGNPDDDVPPQGSGDPNAWRKDKNGRELTPHALYMRFYRSLRSALAV